MYLTVHKNENLLISLKHLKCWKELSQKSRCRLQQLKSQNSKNQSFLQSKVYIARRHLLRRNVFYSYLFFVHNWVWL